MRYEDWDVLLFPYGSKIPFQEFKVNCYAVHDTGKHSVWIKNRY